VAQGRGRSHHKGTKTPSGSVFNGCHVAFASIGRTSPDDFSRLSTANGPEKKEGIFDEIYRIDKIVRLDVLTNRSMAVPAMIPHGRAARVTPSFVS
jgi:hypothetical protein